jgi:hypothetical protein
LAVNTDTADSIYLGDKIISRSSRATGRPGRSDRHVVHLGFGNSRYDGSWSGQIGSAEDSVRVISMVKGEFAELDALSDRSTNAIYLEDHIVSKFGRATDHPGWRGGHVEVLGFENSRGDGSLGS